MRKYLPCLVAALAFTVLPSTAYCQIVDDAPAPSVSVPSDTGFVGALTSGEYAKTVTLSDMSAPGQNWVQFQISTSGSSGFDYLSAVMAAYGGTPGDLANRYFTRGQQIMIGDTPYLVAYKLPGKPLDFAAMMRSGNFQPTPAPPLTPASTLNPALLNLRTLPGMTDIQPFSLDATLAESRKTTDLFASAADRAKQTAGTSNAKQIGLGIIQYVQDHDEKFPPMTSASLAKKAIYPYVKNDDVFLDPETNTPFVFNAYYSGRSLAQIESPSEEVIFYSQPNGAGQRIVCFADSHAKVEEASAWPGLKAKSHIRD